jgi:hypothetical protein
MQGSVKYSGPVQCHKQHVKHWCHNPGSRPHELLLKEHSVQAMHAGLLVQLEGTDGISCLCLCLPCALQDKHAQKHHFAAAGVPVAPFADISSESALQAAAADFGFPLMLKSKR